MPCMHHEFATEEAAVASLAEALARQLDAGIRARGRASLVVSGGRTPVPLFHALRNHQLNWSAVTVTLADERWLAPDHPDANARLVATELLQDAAAAARFLPLTTGAPEPHGEEARVDTVLAELDWPVDAILLGMGEDGHTASLFADAPELAHALAGRDASGRGPSRCCAMTPQAAPHSRMTLTLPALLDCRLLVLHLQGSEKRVTLERAMGDGPVQDMPVRALLRQNQTKLHLYTSPDR